ncbi:MAG: hypothetical protein MUE98_00230 [Rhodobacteraceae bacterium]|jgi:hypothetical protein|nr:hypothetical protein [Paracoccaceae bacterium]
MSYTQAQLDALDAAIASGVLSAEYDGKRLTYRSMAELISARNTVAKGLAAQAGSLVTRHVNPVFDRGV